MSDMLIRRGVIVCTCVNGGMSARIRIDSRRRRRWQIPVYGSGVALHWHWHWYVVPIPIWLKRRAFCIIRGYDRKLPLPRGNELTREGHVMSFFVQLDDTIFDVRCRATCDEPRPACTPIVPAKSKCGGTIHHRRCVTKHGTRSRRCIEHVIRNGNGMAQ